MKYIFIKCDISIIYFKERERYQTDRERERERETSVENYAINSQFKIL